MNSRNIINLIDNRKLDELSSYIDSLDRREKRSVSKELKDCDPKYLIIFNTFSGKQRSFIAFAESDIPWCFVSRYYLPKYKFKPEWLSIERLKDISLRMYCDLAIFYLRSNDELPSAFIDYYANFEDESCEIFINLLNEGKRCYKTFLQYLEVKPFHTEIHDFSYHKNYDDYQSLFYFAERYANDYRITFNTSSVETLMQDLLDEFDEFGNFPEYALLSNMIKAFPELSIVTKEKFKELIINNCSAKILLESLDIKEFREYIWGDWIEQVFIDNYEDLAIGCDICKILLREFPQLEKTIKIYGLKHFHILGIFGDNISEIVIDTVKELVD